MNAITPNVFVRHGAVVANSRDVAAFFSKRHDHVLRDISNLLKELAPQNWGAENHDLFVERHDHHEGANRVVRSFDMTRTGFLLLAMGFTGAKALGFKLRYIEAFDAMEAALNSTPPLPHAEEPITDADLMPDDLRAWTHLVREARLLHGRAVARRLWARSPLPQVATEPTDIHEPPPSTDLDAHGCLDRLLSWRPDGDDGPSVAEVIGRPFTQDLRKYLSTYGVLIHPPKAPGYFAVANQNRHLASLFRPSRWADLWPVALMQLPGAKRPNRRPGVTSGVTYIGGKSTRYVLLPVELVP